MKDALIDFLAIQFDNKRVRLTARALCQTYAVGAPLFRSNRARQNFFLANFRSSRLDQKMSTTDIPLDHLENDDVDNEVPLHRKLEKPILTVRTLKRCKDV